MKWLLVFWVTTGTGSAETTIDRIVLEARSQLECVQLAHALSSTVTRDQQEHYRCIEPVN